MTERLTKREGKHTVRIGNEWRRHDPVWDKLAHYEDLEERCLEEYSFGLRTLMWKWSGFYKDIDQFIKWRDLEEQGRLHIVPKEFWEAIVTYLVNDRCPYDFRLKGFNEEDCKVDDVRCKECWETALKGE